MRGLLRPVEQGLVPGMPLPWTPPRTLLPQTLEPVPGSLRHPRGNARGRCLPPDRVVPVVGAGTAVAASADGGSNRNRMIAAAAAVGAIAVALLLGIGASGMLAGGVAVEPAGSSVAVVEHRAVDRAIARADPVPHRGPRPRRRTDPEPAPTPTPTPAGRQARILGIAITNGRYVVDYEVFGYTPALPGRHVHFFFDTVSVADAGVPGNGPWFLYAGPVPFTGYKVSDRPDRARTRCASSSPTPTTRSSRTPETASTFHSARMSTSMGPSDLATEVRRIVDRGARTSPAGQTSRGGGRLATRQRLDEPLRVAIAGRVKAGKSTLLNALVGERLAATDAGECTRIVTWYRNALGYQVVAEPGGRRLAATSTFHRRGRRARHRPRRPRRRRDRTARGRLAVGRSSPT